MALKLHANLKVENKITNKKKEELNKLAFGRGGGIKLKKLLNIPIKSEATIF